MNLKQAAAVIGVHYQTAYKWVRSGELIAVRIGGRYEVSEAAIEGFQARRSALMLPGLPADIGFQPVDGADHALEELESMLIEPFLGLETMTRFVARRAAETVGGACLVTVFGADGRPRCMSLDHPNPGYAALIGGLLETFGPLTTIPGLAYPARSPKVIRWPQVPQDVFRSHVLPELQQHLSLYPVRSLVSVPVVIDGQQRGAISCTGSEADRPHSDEDVTVLHEMAERVGRLIVTAEDVTIAARVRAELTQGLSLLVQDRQGEVPSSEIAPWFDRVTKHVALPVAVMDRDRVLVAVNPAFQRIRSGEGNAVGSVFEATTHPDDQAADQASFGRLTSGELDYLDVVLRRQRPRGEVMTYTAHRSAVRG